MNILNLLRRRANEPAIAEDIEAHVAERTDDFIDQGLSPDEARAKARREFGNITLLKEKSRDEWSMGLLGRSGSDLGYAVRSLRRNPGFTITVLATLALGIGANGAIFNLLHAVLVRALPVPDAEQLRILTPITKGEAGEQIFSYPVLTEMQTEAGSRASLAGYSSVLRARVGAGADSVQQADVQLVACSFFQTLQVPAQLGRVLSPSDDRSTGNFPAVLSDRYWSTHFARDVSVVGRHLILNGAPVTIAGVAVPGFFGIEPGQHPDYWVPVSAQRDLRYNRNYWNSNGDSDKQFMLQPQIRWLGVVARIPNARLEPFVLAAVNQVYARDMKREGQKRDRETQAELLRTKVRLDPGAKGLGSLRDRFAEPLLVLMWAVALVLLIASVNLASLALARINARRKEIAVRCSVGAGRGRILSQLLAETALLGAAGGLISIPVALWGSRILLRWASSRDLIPLVIGIDPPLLIFIALAAAVVGLLFGLFPALQALQFSLSGALKASASSVKGMRLPWGRTLIGAQVAFSFVLLAGAVLFVRTLMNYSHVPLGFIPRQVLSVQIDPLGAHFRSDQLSPLYHRLLDRLPQLPGVQSVALATCELAVGCKGISDIRVAGHPSPSGAGLRIQENTVSPGYFQTVGMSLIQGSAFDWHDNGAKPILAVINQTAANAYFGGSKAIGQHFGYGDNDHQYQVIGIVSDARVNNIHEPPTPLAYYSLVQNPAFVSSLEILTRSDPEQIALPIRSAIRAADPNLPVMQVHPLTTFIDDNLLRERLLARLASVFAILALALACLGVHGVLSYTIARRTSEIGIRLALGAQPESVRWMVLREALLVLAVGLLAGVPASIVLIQLVQKLLFGLTAADPASLAISLFSLLLAGTAAALLPAWRASRVDPMVALRYE